VDPEHRRVLRTIDFGASAVGWGRLAALSPDGALVAAVTPSNLVEIQDAASGRVGARPVRVPAARSLGDPIAITPLSAIAVTADRAALNDPAARLVVVDLDVSGWPATAEGMDRSEPHRGRATAARAGTLTSPDHRCRRAPTRRRLTQRASVTRLGFPESASKNSPRASR